MSFKNQTPFKIYLHLHRKHERELLYDIYIRSVIYSSFILSIFISLHRNFISNAFSVSIIYLLIKFSLLHLLESTIIDFDDFSYRKNVNK